MSPTTGSPPASDWRTWTARTWSNRLFDAVFRTGDLSEPVRFLPATPLDLCRITADAGADPEAVEAAFVQALRASPQRVKAALTTNDPAFRAAAANRTQVPGYLAHLVLTCLVAGGGGDTIDLNRFQERFRLALGHEDEVGEGYYQFEGLAALWEALRDHVQHLADAGECRPIVLPLKRPVRIGYSQRLAFPSLWERRRLATLFAYCEGEPPGLRAAIMRFDDCRKDFAEHDPDSELVAQFDDMRTRFLRCDYDLRTHPFWAAVLDAVSTDYSTTPRTRPRAGLVVPDPAALDVAGHLLTLALAIGPLPSGTRLPHGLALESLEDPVAAFGHVVSANDGRDPVADLLDEGGRAFWPALRSSPLGMAVAQGVLVFSPDESGWPVTQFALPDAGRRVWLLTRASPRVKKLLWLVLDDCLIDEPPVPRPSAYAGWEWVGPLDAKHLDGLAESFSEIAAFQPSVLGPALRLGGGAPVGDAFLGAPGVLPWVSVRVSDPDDVPHVSVERMMPATGDRVHLARADDVFWDLPNVALDGTATYVARHADGREIGRTSARFVAGVVAADYLAPSSPSAWVAEAAWTDVVRWDEALTSTSGGSCAPYGRHLPPLARSEKQVVGQATVAAAPPADIRVLPDAVAAFVEVAAARSSRRAGLPEAHFLSLLSAVLGAPSGPLLWLTARAYVEAGFFDVLTPRRWPSRTYAACPPRFVAWTDAHGPAVSLVGLAPAWLRRQIRTKADALGLIEATPTPVSSLVPSPLVFRGPTPSALAALASATELPSPADLVPLSELCAPPAIVADAASIVAPEFHVSAGVWSWTRGGFHAEPPRRRLATPDSDVMLRRLVHPRAPTQYAVEADGVAPRFFRGDAWARLWALALRGAPAFAPDAQGRLVRASPSPVHLPVPVARALATVAGAPGPTTGADGWPGYANPTTPEALAAILAVWGNACRHVSPSAAARARALAQRVQTAVGPRVPVSRVLARRLAPFGHDASVATLLSGGLPVHLVPHLTALARALDSLRP